MNVFDFRNNVFENYAEYIKSFVRLNALSNPLVHTRSMGETTRKNGEQAIAWF